MSVWVPARRPSRELLDDDLACHEAEASLADIEWVHRHLGGRRLLRRGLLPFLGALDGARGRPLTLADLGSGSGHVGRDVRALLGRAAGDVRLVDVDLKLAHVRLAPRGSAVAGDVLALPLGDRSVDVAFSTLFLHHFSADELRRVLSEAARVSRRGVAAFDLSRHRAALAIISVVGPLFFRSRVSMCDGRASVRQAYTPEEMREIARPVLPGARVEALGPFAFALTWRRP